MQDLLPEPDKEAVNQYQKSLEKCLNKVVVIS